MHHSKRKITPVIPYCKVDKSVDDVMLEGYLSSLEDEVISIIPNIVPKFHMMGATGGYDYLLIVEIVD